MSHIAKCIIIICLLTITKHVHSLCFPRDNWHVERRTLFYPELQEVAQVLKRGLRRHFNHVQSQVVDCPDLREKPYDLANEGMTGSPRVLDVGSFQYLIPRPNFSKSYSLADMMSFAELNSAFAVGAGAGPFEQLGYNSEGFYNFNVRNCTLDQHSASIIITDNDGRDDYKLFNLNNSQTDVGLVGNLFASKGEPGKIVRLNLKQRTTDSFVLPNGIRTILSKHFGKEKPIAVGLIGIFARGTALTSIMPNFSKEPVPAFADWVHYFRIKSPLVMVGTIVTEDQGLDLYTPHVHMRNKYAGGHFVNDVSPEIVEYDILLSPAEYIYRVDQPTKTA